MLKGNILKIHFHFIISSWTFKQQGVLVNPKQISNIINSIETLGNVTMLVQIIKISPFITY